MITLALYFAAESFVSISEQWNAQFADWKFEAAVSPGKCFWTLRIRPSSWCGSLESKNNNKIRNLECWSKYITVVKSEKKKGVSQVTIWWFIFSISFIMMPFKLFCVVTSLLLFSCRSKGEQLMEILLMVPMSCNLVIYNWVWSLCSVIWVQILQMITTHM